MFGVELGVSVGVEVTKVGTSVAVGSGVWVGKFEGTVKVGPGVRESNGKKAVEVALKLTGSGEETISS